MRLTSNKLDATGRFFTRQDSARCTLKVKKGNTYRLTFRYRASDAGRKCPFWDNPTSPPCSASLAPLGAGPASFPFGHKGSDDSANALPMFGEGAGGGAAALAASPIEYRVIWAFRRAFGTTAATDAFWSTFKPQSDPPLPLPNASWQPATVDVVVSFPTWGTADITGLSFGAQVKVVAGGVTDPVMLDVDNFCYCRVTADATDPVQPCATACLP